MAWRSAVLACCVCLIAGSARADSEGDSVAPRIDVSAGAHYMLTPESVCQRDADVVGCSGEGFLGGQVAVLWRPLDHFSAGPTLAIAGQPGDDGTAQHQITMLRLALEGRYLLNAHSRSGLYVAAEAGALFISESVEWSRTAQGEATQAGALLGAGIGYLFALPFGLGVGLSLRGFYTFMPDEPPELGTDYEAHEWGALPWLALALDASFGVGL